MVIFVAASLLLPTCYAQQVVNVTQIIDHMAYRGSPIPPQVIIFTSSPPQLSILDRLVMSVNVMLKSLFMGWFIYEVLKQVLTMALILGLLLLMAVGLSSNIPNADNYVAEMPPSIGIV